MSDTASILCEENIDNAQEQQEVGEEEPASIAWWKKPQRNPGDEFVFYWG